VNTNHVPEPVLDASVRIDGLPPEGRAIMVEADAEQREAIARELGITAVERLRARLRAVGFRGGIRVTGDLDARIEQPCVVSLEPVHQDIAEPIDRVFMPGREPQPASAGHADIFVDLEGDDLPDYFEGPEADLSPMIIETLALAIDPYPRAPGAELDTNGLDPDDPSDSPFAALARLKAGGGQGGNDKR
jgi:uncharacterized metal-binding protein YceD (DUF177 family)